tara:strand:- start:412 stop:903 length:492 start_codon:yes stop_codon:yes gene_type:complete
VPQELKDDPVLYGECLGGALYIEDFRRMLISLGCFDYRVIAKKRIKVDSPKLKAKCQGIDFYSFTIRLFKLALEDICEDYGQSVVYSGTMPGHPHQFILDDHHIFIANKQMLVCGNTADMLEKSRYGKYFKINGDKSTHFGAFRCSPASQKDSQSEPIGGSCC